jgi:lipoate-protein ligase A
MKNQSWRFIYTGVGDPYSNMATDEVLLNSVQKGSPPVLRVYEWNPAAISIGYFQAVKKTVDIDRCDKAGVKLVRRITGGRAVLHNKELTYSFCGSSRNFPELGRNVSETYQRISQALLFSLEVLGIEAQWAKPKNDKSSSGKSFYNLPCFSSFSRYEISFQGKKLIGSAQRRFGDFFLQHGSILLNNERLGVTGFLPADNSLSGGIDLEENSIGLEGIKGNKIELLQLIQSLREGFSRFFQRDFAEDFLTSYEQEGACRLIKEKYTKESWNYKY